MSSLTAHDRKLSANSFELLQTMETSPTQAPRAAAAAAAAKERRRRRKALLRAQRGAGGSDGSGCATPDTAGSLSDAGAAPVSRFAPSAAPAAASAAAPPAADERGGGGSAGEPATPSSPSRPAPPAPPAPPAAAAPRPAASSPAVQWAFDPVLGPRRPVEELAVMTARPLRSRSGLEASPRRHTTPAPGMAPLPETPASPPFRGGGGGGAAAAAAAPAARRRPPFWSYVGAELALRARAAPPPPSVAPWGQTERERVYNALLAVPLQLERFAAFGGAACLDAFLAVFTVLPLRLALAGAGAAAAAARAALAGPAPAGGRGGAGVEPSAATWRLRGDQLYDVLCAAVFAAAAALVASVSPGAIYFWMKDMTHEFLKLSVLHTTLELADKICASFGADALEALAASCAAACEPGPRPRAARRRAAAAVAADAALAAGLAAAHGGVLLAQALVFGVAMASRKRALVGLLIAANFSEIKGTVLKRFDPARLYQLACQDVVERAHLAVVLAFVLVEEAGAAGRAAPSAALAAAAAKVFAAEVGIDVLKHAVLGKFNELRPGVYSEFTRDLAEAAAAAAPGARHRLVGFVPYAPAALALRVGLAAAALAREHGGGGGGWGARRLAAAWAAALAAKLALGWALQAAAAGFLERYDARRARAAAAAAAARRAPAAASPKAGLPLPPRQRKGD